MAYITKDDWYTWGIVEDQEYADHEIPDTLAEELQAAHDAFAAVQVKVTQHLQSQGFDV